MAAKLGRDYRLFVGNSATPANDSAYTVVLNEVGLSYKWTNDIIESQTKQAGVKRYKGNTSYEISVELAENATDPGYVLLADNKGDEWPYQIRYKDLVILEGTFIGSEAEVSGEANNVGGGSLTLMSSGEVTEDVNGRALVTA